MKEASLYIRIVECFLLLIVGLCFLYYFFEEREEDHVEEFEAVLDASANLQQYIDFGKLLDPVSYNLNPNGIQQSSAQTNYYKSKLGEINAYCNTRDPENILSSSIYRSKDFSVCKTPPIKADYRPTVIVEGFDINNAREVKDSSGLVTIPPGVTSFDYTVIGGGGAGGGGGARFNNKKIGNRGAGGGGGGSSGGVVRGSATIDDSTRIYVDIGKGGVPIRGSRYTHNSFNQKGTSENDKDFRFTDAGVAVINPGSTRELPWGGRPTTLSITGKPTITAHGGNGGFAGGNVGMAERNNRTIVRNVIEKKHKGSKYKEFHYFFKNWGFGSDGGEAVPGGAPGQRGNDGNENLGNGNTAKGGDGGKLGQPRGFGDGGNGGYGASDFYGNRDDGSYGSAGNNGAVFIQWK